MTSCPPVIIKAAGPNAPASTDTQAHTQTNARWACTQGHAVTYSQPGSGPLRAQGTESLVLGTQLFFVLDWAMPQVPRKDGSGETLRRTPRDEHLGENKNLLHPSQL